MARFEAAKARALARLQRRGADEEIATILQQINARTDFYTTSSCSGRIVLILLPEIGAKREAVFLGKWHRPVEHEEVLAVMEDAPFTEGELWLLAQSPIIHVACRTVEKAKALLQLALDAGFKYSGMKGIARDTGIVVVEMLSTERMDVPLASRDKVFVDEAYVAFIVTKANFILHRGREKLKQFELRLQELS
ncbi:MAG: tRNA-wybutosine modification methyltransferase TYW3 [Candidatus Methanospirareceae archaeon]